MRAMIPSGSCVGPPLPRCLHVYMLACPLVKLAHLIGRLAARLDLHRRLALGRRVANGRPIRDMVGAGVKPIILPELRGFVLHPRRGPASPREYHEHRVAAPPDGKASSRGKRCE